MHKVLYVWLLKHRKSQYISICLPFGPGQSSFRLKKTKHILFSRMFQFVYNDLLDLTKQFPLVVSDLSWLPVLKITCNFSNCGSGDIEVFCNWPHWLLKPLVNDILNLLNKFVCSNVVRTLLVIFTFGYHYLWKVAEQRIGRLSEIVQFAILQLLHLKCNVFFIFSISLLSAMINCL